MGTSESYEQVRQYLYTVTCGLMSQQEKENFGRHIHGQCPALITIPTENRSKLTVQSTDTVRYLGLYINHKLNWHQHITIMASHARGSLKALQLLGNSIHGLNHGNWHLVYNTVCLPVLTYSSPIWYKGQKKLVNILQRVQDFTVRKILGTFCTMPVGPLHQLCTILPMHICLQMLSETAALSLLTILHNSQLIQRLGLPWCDWSKVHDGFLNTPHPAPHTPLSQLANLVPTDSCHPETFKYGPWVRRVIASDHLTTSTNIPCREDRKQLSRDIAKEAKGSQPNMLLLFCHGASPSNEDGTPIATAACIACFKGKVTDSLTHSLGPHTSVK